MKNKQSLPNPLLLFKPKKALVLGDFMVDVYSTGEVNRISPEAPVLILKVKEEEMKPGGAGNAILNMVSLGMKVFALGRVGDDSEGEAFTKMLSQDGVDTKGIVIDKSCRTPLKKRLIADNQQLLRLDYEEPTPLSSSLEKVIMKKFDSLIDQVDLVAISDYAKGFLTPSLLSLVISKAKAKKKPVIIDPKRSDFKHYRGATLIKPNLKEALQASGLTSDVPLDRVAKKIIRDSDIDTLLITRAKEGISLFTKGGLREDFPAHAREVKDVTGAGDTVFAVLAQTLANKISLSQGALLANAAASLTIERLGCARITLSELKERLDSLFR